MKVFLAVSALALTASLALKYSPLEQMPQALPQQVAQEIAPLGLAQLSPQAQQVSQPSFPADDRIIGYATPDDQAQAVNVQDVLGLVGSMGDQQRKTRSLEVQLQKAQASAQQLHGMVLAETARSNTIDQNARQLAQQAQESIFMEKATVDDLREQLAKFKAQADNSGKKLVAEEQKNGNLTSLLSQAQATLKDWQQKVVTANKRAEAAEVRATNALKAGELEEMALTQQEELIKKLKAESSPPSKLEEDLSQLRLKHAHVGHHRRSHR